MRSRPTWVLIAALACVLQTPAQSGRDGDILSSEPYPKLPEFDSLDDFSRNYFPRAVYDEARTQSAFDVLAITYASEAAGGKYALHIYANDGHSLP